MAGEAVPHPGEIVPESSLLPETALLLLRIWTTGSGPFGWHVSEPLAAMFRQALESSGGSLPSLETLQTEPLPVVFPSTDAAIRACRRLQALATGYATESKGRIAGISLLVCPEQATDGAALARFLQQKSRPAQTLLAVKRGGLPPQGHKIEAFFADVELYEVAYAHQDEAALEAEALLRDRRDTPAAESPVVHKPSATSKDAPAWAILRGAYTPRRVAGLLGAVAAVAFGLAIVHRPEKRAATEVAPAVQSSTRLPPAPSSPSEPPHAEEQPRKIEAPRKPPPSPEPPRTVEKQPRGRGDLTAEQIRQILSRGQDALDRGCYTEAMSLYRRVLDDDPRNGSATGGMEKARLRMRLSGEDPVCSR